MYIGFFPHVYIHIPTHFKKSLSLVKGKVFYCKSLLKVNTKQTNVSSCHAAATGPWTTFLVFSF